ncbi:jerky protein homolog-like [Hydra vulgaris]|uniref:Jerky protein homolog-like n=1 Tax=Hydra vulgaris TaxID=6087 RepID=A0ABM4BNR3_HYDVU
MGVTDLKFKNNLPGPDWIKSFIVSNHLTARIADYIKPARAEIDRNSVCSYFDELSITLQDFPKTNIFNYDETNVSDNPSSKTVVCKRGLKRIERKMQHSKGAISIMYCGSVAGQFLSPMVVYKAANCYIEWKNGDSTGSIFDSSKSGWFDYRTFEHWFREIFISETASLTGTKVVIRDNLTSHFSSDIIKACLENNIRFTCLIPNAPHLLQPLDIAVFRSLKVEWKKILQTWRKESRIKSSIAKNHFQRS